MINGKREEHEGRVETNDWGASLNIVHEQPDNPCDVQWYHQEGI